MLTCVRCGSDLATDGCGPNYSPAVDVTCSRCVLGLVSRVEQQQHQRLAAIDIEAFVTARKAHGWTQGDLACKLGVPQSQVSAFERGKAQPNAKLADWFESEVD